MNRVKTKSIEAIEERMGGIDENSVRYQTLKSAKSFKTSWIELGRALYIVWKDKLYKEWGYLTFDAYIQKEVGIRKQTAMKLLKSYYFLEKEEPAYLERSHAEAHDAVSIPNYESVDLLRLAKNKKALDEKDYSNIKKEVLELGYDARDVKKGLSSIMRQREEASGPEAREKKRLAAIRRLLGTLKALKKGLEAAKVLPAAIIKETANLISRIESEIG